jgi:hypothetical protein
LDSPFGFGHVRFDLQNFWPQARAMTTLMPNRSPGETTMFPVLVLLL